jgi:hypothetical protein
MRAHVYILAVEHEDLTQGQEIRGVYTSERKAKAAARALAEVARLTWTTNGSTRTHRWFSLAADGPTPETEYDGEGLPPENESAWRYTISVVRPE